MKLFALLTATILLASHASAQVKNVTKNISTNGLVENLVVPSGKTLTINSGGSIINNGTATGFTATAAWGSITGTLSSQTDLQTALDAKLASATAASTYLPLTGGNLSGSLVITGDFQNNRADGDGGGGLFETRSTTRRVRFFGENGDIYIDPQNLSAPERILNWPNVPFTKTIATTDQGDGSITKTDITGTAVTLTDTGTVTSGMLAGSIALSKLAITGTPDGTKYLRDDGTWQTVTSGATLSANTFTGLQQFSGTDHAGLRLNNLTTVQRDALASPAAGMVIWNTTDGRMQLHNGSAWTSGMVRLSGDTMTGALVNSTNSAASTPALHLTGSIFTGGTGTTNTPHVLIQPSSGVTANTGWSAQGTALGIVLPAASTLANFIHLRRGNISYLSINGTGRATGFEVVAAGASGFASYTSQGNAHQESVSGRAIMASVEATGIRLASAYQIRWSSTAAGSGDVFNNNDTILSRIGVGILGIEGSSTGGAMQLREMTAPSAPAADRARLWIEDNGSGKTRLMIQFGSGTAQQIAIEP